MAVRFLTCKHCQGTTYCATLRRRVAGKEKRGPACPSCLIKSGLPPLSLIRPVVCSVCDGRGLVEAVKLGPASWVGVLVLTLLLSVVGLGGMAVGAFLIPDSPQDQQSQSDDGTAPSEGR